MPIKRKTWAWGAAVTSAVLWFLTVAVQLWIIPRPCSGCISGALTIPLLLSAYALNDARTNDTAGSIFLSAVGSIVLSGWELYDTVALR
jgi:hypothetical protein